MSTKELCPFSLYRENGSKLWGGVKGPGNLLYILRNRFHRTREPVMRLESALFREPGEHPLPRGMLTPAPKSRGRPREESHPQVQSPRDVELLRRRGVPLALLTSDWVTENGYPEKFRPLLFVYADLAKQVQSCYRVVPVRDRDALRQPGFEEFVTFLLKVDTLAARAVVLRNQGKYNPRELYPSGPERGTRAPRDKGPAPGVRSGTASGRRATPGSRPRLGRAEQPRAESLAMTEPEIQRADEILRRHGSGKSWSEARRSGSRSRPLTTST